MSPSEALTDTTPAVETAPGDGARSDELFKLAYKELRVVAAALHRRERVGHTLVTSDLVHEAYLRLAGDHDGPWNDRAHFFRVAAETIRRVLIDHARRRGAVRHGGGRARQVLGDRAIARSMSVPDLLALNEALDRLEEEDATKATLVKLRYFGGFTIPEAAEAVGVSHATAERYWRYSRARLYQWMHGEHARPRTST